MTLKDTFDKLDAGRYVNTREIIMGGIPYNARDIILKAPLLAGLNVYLVGDTGEGKTELANDLIGYFGDNSCYMMGRPDFEPSELLKQVNLGKLKDVKTDKELIELTDNVNKMMYYSDELNRAPPIVQNYFFDFMDGKLVHNGKIFQLGKNGYTVGYASGNLGNGEYVGVSNSDRALLDRMHMIIKLDYPDYCTTELDDLRIFSGKKNPRASMPENKDISDSILSMHNDFRRRNVSMILPLLGVYLTKGLDYVENVEKHSKRALGSRWAEAEGVRADTDENKIHPLSKRAVFGGMVLAYSLEAIAKERGQSPRIVDLFLDSLRLTVPFSGVLSPTYVEMAHNGDAYSAFDSLLGADSQNRHEIINKVDVLEEALLLAEAGKKDDALLQDIASQEGKWMPVRNAISTYADMQAENPTEKGKQIQEFIAEAHKSKK
jgi:MoxR-like ATPase